MYSLTAGNAIMTSEAADPYTLVLFTAQSGALSARLDGADGTALHLHSLVDPERESAFFSDLTFWGDRVILAGCGLGYHLKSAIGSLGGDARLLLIEYYDELASRCLSRFPDEVRDRVTVVSRTDPGARNRVTEFISQGKYVQVVKHPPSFRAHREYYRDLLSVAGRKPSAARLPGTVMVMQGNFFLEKEIEAATENGKTAAVPFPYDKWESVTAYESELQRQLQTAQPGAVISVNMLGFDGNGILPEYCRRMGIPLIVWFVDDPRPILLNRKRFVTDSMIAGTWEREYIPWLREQGFGSVNYLPLATDPRQFAATEGGSVTIDCGFVGTAMGSSFLREIADKFLWRAEYGPLAAMVAAKLVCYNRVEVDRLIEEACRGCSPVLPIDDNHTRTWLRSYILHTASMIKRKKVLSALLPLGIETFGDPEGWHELFGSGIITHPDIDYRTEIGSCYRAIRVTVNSTSCQMPTALNQRVFDVPVSGGFVLNDDQADLHELFPEDEIATYRTPEECADKVRFYLSNETRRNEIAAAARTHILNEHTYFHRLQTLLSWC